MYNVKQTNENKTKQNTKLTCHATNILT